MLTTKAGLVVLSGLIDPSSLYEANQGSGIRQADIPTVDSHDSPRRLNVALGKEKPNFDREELVYALGGSSLSLSRITEINGTPVPEYQGDLDRFWNRAPRPPLDIWD